MKRDNESEVSDTLATALRNNQTPRKTEKASILAVAIC